MNVRTMIDRTSIFNELPSLHESNTRLSMQLASMGERSDLAELKTIFEEHGVQLRLGLALLHNHFKIDPGERVVEYGNVSTPWQVPANGNVFGGVTVPRSWRFLEGELQAYEYGFNINGDEMYDTEEVPEDFARQVGGFLTDNGLADILGICTMDGDDGGRVEKTVGRVSVTVPVRRGGDGNGVEDLHGNIEAVWSFDCKRGLESAVMKLARVCLNCGKC